jgi:hypothetical protein
LPSVLQRALLNSGSTPLIANLTIEPINAISHILSRV